MIRLVIFGALLGAPWCLAFAPMSWWWLGLLQLVLLPCLAICTSSARRAAVLGFTFGASAYGLGVSWLYISLNVYGGLPAWLSVLAVLVFGLYLAVFPALAIWVFVAWVRDWVKVLHRPIFSAVLWAALWTFAEWCRGVFLTGFAWLSLGDALVDSPFARLLPWLGNYGALFLVLSAVFSVCLLACCWWRQQSVQVAFSSVFGCVVLCLGILGLMELPVRTQSSGEISLAAVQPNVDQSVKFDPDKVLDNMEQLFRLGDTASGLLGDHSGGVLFFPETVNPVLWGDSPPAWRERFRGFARPNQVSVVMGSALEDQGRYFNSIILLQGDEQGADLVVPKQRHDKRHLVPFGEFIPWGFGWFVSMLNMPMGEFQRGGLDQQPLDVLGQKLTTTVCYEDIFSGEFARFIQQAKQEPTVLVNFSNLAWFGQSWALDQHAQMSRTRSAEHRKPGVRVTNTGFSGAIDEQGQWVKLVQPAQGVVWLASVEGRLGRTWFARCGDFLWFAIWFVVLVWGWQCSKPQKPYNTDD